MKQFNNYRSRIDYQVLYMFFRGTDILSLCKPVTTTYGLNSFRYFAAKNWNSLPNNVRSESTLTILEDY